MITQSRDYQEMTEDGYAIVCDNSKMDVDAIHQYLSEESYWAKGIPKEIVIKAIANSLCFGVFYNGSQVGFARLVTDKATFAYLADVYILEAHRGKCLSKWLMQVIHAHPDVQNLRAWVLRTRDAHTLYEQFGWAHLNDAAVKGYMEKRNQDVYLNLKIS
jgi:GNAT superfamily N-acetyltransferase